MILLQSSLKYTARDKKEFFCCWLLCLSAVSICFSTLYCNSNTRDILWEKGKECQPRCYHCEYCHETQKWTEIMRYFPLEVGTFKSKHWNAAGYLLQWRRQPQACAEETEVITGINESAKEKCVCKSASTKKQERQEEIQENGKRKQLNLFKDSAWLHYRKRPFYSGFFI